MAGCFMVSDILHKNWRPLSVTQVAGLFGDAPFAWCLAGGYAIERFVGVVIRPHDDIDIIVFRDEQLRLQDWLGSWRLYVADPPGTLRQWYKDEFLPVGVHDIWGHQAGVDAWQMQIMLMEAEGSEWYSRRNPLVRGERANLMTLIDGVPCIRLEIQLLYKSRNPRTKDQQDFYACLPMLNPQAKHWLRQNLTLLYPEGHDWLALL